MISGHLVREARLRAGLSQAQLGARSGKAASAVGRWERGEALPPLETLRDLIRACGLELAIAITEGDDHDLALIRRNLERSPEDRLASLVTSVSVLQAMDATRG